jgi:hypothetical protein
MSVHPSASDRANELNGLIFLKLYTGDHRYSVDGYQIWSVSGNNGPYISTHTHAFLCTVALTGRIAVKFDVGGHFMKICRETPSLVTIGPFT